MEHCPPAPRMLNLKIGLRPLAFSGLYHCFGESRWRAKGVNPMGRRGTWWGVAVTAAAAGKHEMVIEKAGGEDDDEVWSCVACDFVAKGNTRETETQLDLHEAETMLTAAYPYLLEYARDEGHTNDEGDAWVEAQEGDVWIIQIEGEDGETGVEMATVGRMSDDHGVMRLAFRRAVNPWLFVTDIAIVSGRRIQ